MTAPTDVRPDDMVVQFSDVDMGNTSTDTPPKSDAPFPPPPPADKPKRRAVRGRRNASDNVGPKPKPETPAYRPGVLVKPLTDVYASVGMGVYMVDEPCGTAILANAEKCAIALDKAAKENEALRRVLNRLVETSALGAVIAAHAPIAMAIAQHHFVNQTKSTPDVAPPSTEDPPVRIVRDGNA